MRWGRSSPNRSGESAAITTSQPSFWSSVADRRPTAPRPITTARSPERSRAFAIRAIVVAAVVLQPFESIITETRKGPKNAFCTSSKISSPAATFLPPTHTAVVLQIVRPAGEERVLGERPRGLGLHAAVREQDVHAGVVRDDRVERARMLLGVELEQDFLHDSSLRAVRRTRSRRGSSKVR